jgi:hypothetical protein
MAIKHSPGCQCCVACPDACSSVVYIRQPSSSAPAGRPWNEDTAFTEIVTTPSSSGGTTLLAGETIAYKVKACASSYGLKIEIEDCGLDSARAAGYDGFRIKVNDHLQSHLRGESLTPSNVIGTPLAGLNFGSNTYLNCNSLACGGELGGFAFGSANLSQTLYFSEIDHECYRVGTAAYAGASNGVYDRIPPVEAGKLDIFITIEAGDDDIEIGEISYVTGNGTDLATNHYTHASVADVPVGYVRSFRENIDAIFDITDPVATLTSRHFVNNGGGDTCGGTVLTFDVQTSIDNTQFDGTHVIDLYFSQRAKDWYVFRSSWTDPFSITQWADSVAVSDFTAFNDTIDQFRDLDSWNHAKVILEYGGFAWEDKEMDLSSRKLTIVSSTNAATTMLNPYVHHANPANHINKYLKEGVSYPSHAGLMGITVDCANSTHLIDDSDIVPSTFSGSRTVWPVTETTEAVLQKIEPTTFGVSADYDDTYTFSNNAQVSAGGTFLSKTGFGANCTLTYTHTIFGQRSYGRYDIIDDHCPHGSPSWQYPMKYMFLKEGALTGIKVYDTDGTTIIFESEKIYYDETKPQAHPTDSYSDQFSQPPSSSFYRRTLTGMMMMDGIGGFAGNTWGIYIPNTNFGSSGYFQVFKVVDFSSLSQSFTLAYADSGNDSSSFPDVTWSFSSTNGSGYKLEATYHR